jgi:hypothetical protein
LVARRVEWLKIIERERYETRISSGLEIGPCMVRHTCVILVYSYFIIKYAIAQVALPVEMYT